MSELSFLIQLLLNDDVPVKVKLLLADRIKEVEANLTVRPVAPQPAARPAPQMQAASTLAALERHGMIDMAVGSAGALPVPIEQIAQTPAAAAALAQRNAIMQGAASGKPQAGATSPHKFRGQLRDQK